MPGRAHKFDTAEDVLRWIVKNWHYVPGDPLAKIIDNFLEQQAKAVKENEHEPK